MKPFNLEKALAGEPVVTRDGLEVTSLHIFEGVNTAYKLYGVVDSAIESWTETGRNLTLRENILDLFMAPKTVTLWVNVYPGKTIPYSSAIFSTESLADERASSGRIGGKAWKLEIEV